MQREVPSGWPRSVRTAANAFSTNEEGLWGSGGGIPDCTLTGEFSRMGARWSPADAAGHGYPERLTADDMDT